MLNVTDKTFKQEVLEQKGLVIVDFWAEWCGPCRAIAPILEVIAEKYGDSIKIVKLDVETNPIITKQYDVLGIPSLLFFQNGYLAETNVGLVSIDEIESVIAKLLG